MKPLHDTVYVKPTDRETKTSSGLTIADSAIEKPHTGTVIAVGEGRALDNGTVQKTVVKEGDKVIFNKYAPDEVEIDGQKLLQMTERDIFATL